MSRLGCKFPRTQRQARRTAALLTGCETTWVTRGAPGQNCMCCKRAHSSLAASILPQSTHGSRACISPCLARHFLEVHQGHSKEPTTSLSPESSPQTGSNYTIGLWRHGGSWRDRGQRPHGSNNGQPTHLVPAPKWACHHLPDLLDPSSSCKDVRQDRVGGPLDNWALRSSVFPGRHK